MNRLFLSIVIFSPLLLTGFLWDSPDGQRDELSFVTKGTPSLGAGTGELSQELMQALEGVGRQPRGQARARGLRVSDETVIAKSRHRTPKGVSTKKPRATSHLRLRDAEWSKHFFKTLGGGGFEIAASRDRASGRGRSSSSSSSSLATNDRDGFSSAPSPKRPAFSKIKMHLRRPPTVQEIVALYRVPTDLVTDFYHLFKRFHATVQQHHIPYCAFAGTVLGAVRHGGLIPWDDDMDVSMLESDVKTLLKPAVVEDFHQAGLQLWLVTMRDGKKIWTSSESENLLDLLKTKKAGDLHHIKINNRGHQAPLFVDSTHAFLDVLFFQPEDDGENCRYIYCAPELRKVFPRFWLRQDNLNYQEVPFGPLKIFIPSNVDDYLTRFYGSTWSTECRITHIPNLARKKKIPLPVSFPMSDAVKEAPWHGRKLFSLDELFEAFTMPLSASTALYDIFAKVDRICTRLGIVYYANGGTALGAVRHGGMIPWDDDVDLALDTKNFQRLFSEDFRQALDEEGLHLWPCSPSVGPWDNSTGVWGSFSSVERARVNLIKVLHKGQPPDGTAPFVDLFYYRWKDGRLSSVSGEWPTLYYTPDNLERVRRTFGPTTIWMPSLPEEYCEHAYGKGWRNPLASHIHCLRDDPRTRHVGIFHDRLAREPLRFPAEPRFFRPADWDRDVFPDPV